MQTIDQTTEEIETEELDFAYLNEGNELTPIEEKLLKKIGYYYLDEEHQIIYHYEKELYNVDGVKPGSIQIKKIPEDILFENFNIYERDDRYATDSKQVYYLNNISAAYDILFEFTTIEEADPTSFEPKIVEFFEVSQGNDIQKSISRDKNYVFYEETIIESADPETFIITDVVSINKDKNNVFLRWEIIPNADPNTYEVILDTSAAAPGLVLGRDSENLFLNLCLIEGVDIESISVVDFDRYSLELMDKGGTFTITPDTIQNTCPVVRN